MTENTRIYQLTAVNALIKAPLKYGLYTLFDSFGNDIYHGKAETETLRERLLHHINSKDPGLENACFFCIELVQSVRKMWHMIDKVSDTPHSCVESLASHQPELSRTLAVEGILYATYMN